MRCPIPMRRHRRQCLHILCRDPKKPSSSPSKPNGYIAHNVLEGSAALCHRVGQLDWRSSTSSPQDGYRTSIVLRHCTSITTVHLLSQHMSCTEPARRRNAEALAKWDSPRHLRCELLVRGAVEADGGSCCTPHPKQTRQPYQRRSGARACQDARPSIRIQRAAGQDGLP